MADEKQEAVYLYCFSRADITLVQGVGVDGVNPIFKRVVQGIGAILSLVSLEEFIGPGAEARMQDLSWIGPRALRHEELIEEISHHSPVFPARFGTLFNSFQSLEEVVGRHKDTITAFLDRMVGKWEWAVKGYLDRRKALDSFAVAALGKELGVAQSPGAKYLRERRMQVSGDRDLSLWLKESCGNLYEAIRSVAKDSTERNVLQSGITDVDGEMVLNWAFLLHEEDVPQLHLIIDRANTKYADMGLSLHYSGPWPPYSFTPTLTMESD